MAIKRDNRTTTALYNLAKKQELSKKTGSGKAAADKAARQTPIAAMNRKSAQIKADIKKRTSDTVTRAKKEPTKMQKAAYIPKSKQVKARSSKQRAFLAIKFKKK